MIMKGTAAKEAMALLERMVAMEISAEAVLTPEMVQRFPAAPADQLGAVVAVEDAAPAAVAVVVVVATEIWWPVLAAAVAVVAVAKVGVAGQVVQAVPEAAVVELLNSLLKVELL